MKIVEWQDVAIRKNFPSRYEYQFRDAMKALAKTMRAMEWKTFSETTTGSTFTLPETGSYFLTSTGNELKWISTSASNTSGNWSTTPVGPR